MKGTKENHLSNLLRFSQYNFYRFLIKKQSKSTCPLWHEYVSFPMSELLFMPKMILITLLFGVINKCSHLSIVSSSQRTSFMRKLLFPFPTCEDVTLSHGCVNSLFFLHMKRLNIQDAKLPIFTLYSSTITYMVEDR